MDYVYLGERLTDPKWKGEPCRAVKSTDGKCIRGRNGSMMVEFTGKNKCIVIGRQLGKIT